MGTVILGKLESGSISKAQQLVMMPNRVRFPPFCPNVTEKTLLLRKNFRASICLQRTGTHTAKAKLRFRSLLRLKDGTNESVLQHTVEVLSLLSDDVETDDACPGENLKLRLKGIEEEEILPGFILCSPDNLCHSGRTFDAQVAPGPVCPESYCFVVYV